MSKVTDPTSRGGLLAFALAAVTVALPAGAGGPAGRDVTVRYADLDVESVAGATLLLRRIEGAADRVCAPLDHGDLVSRANRDACDRKLTAAAVTRVNHPVLAAVYESSHRGMRRVVAQAK